MLLTKLKHPKHIQYEPGIFEGTTGAGNQTSFLSSRATRSALIVLYVQVSFFYL